MHSTYVPGYLVLVLATKLIMDAHVKMDLGFGRTSCQRCAGFFSSQQDAPVLQLRRPSPSPAGDRGHHQPYQLLRSGS
jgi:hypothetical protein